MVARSIGAVLIASLALGAAQASARGVRIDFEDANFEFSGQAWDPLVTVAVENDASTTAIDLGFTINFGAGDVDTLFINENGYVSFGSAIAFDGGAGSLADLGGNVVAPYYSNLQSVTPQPGTTFVDQSVSYSVGQLDREAPFENQADAPLAMRITWYGLLDANSNPITFQALFVQVGTNGDFDLEFNYGSAGSAPFAAPSLAGFVLGSNTFDMTGPFGASADYTFAFRNGALQDGTNPPPISVPEPGSLGLLATGLALLCLRVQRRRRA